MAVGTDFKPPRTVADASLLLLANWNVPGNPVAAPELGDPTNPDPWTVLTRRSFPDVPGLAQAVANARRQMLDRAGVSYGLPPVLVRLPLEHLTQRGIHGWSEMGGDPSAEVLTEDGYPGFPFRVGVPVRPYGRKRWAVVGGDVDHLPPEPFTTHALAVGSLAASKAAEAVRKWSGHVGSAADGRRARAEADGYAAVARELEAAIPATATWAEDLNTWADWPPAPPERTGSSWI